MPTAVIFMVIFYHVQLCTQLYFKVPVLQSTKFSKIPADPENFGAFVGEWICASVHLCICASVHLCICASVHVTVAGALQCVKKTVKKTVF